MSEVKVYENPAQFWTDASPLLKKEEAKNSLILGVSYLFQSDPTNCIYQSALIKNNEVLGALVQSNYKTNYTIQPSPTANIETAGLLLNHFIKSGLKLTGIMRLRTIKSG